MTARTGVAYNGYAHSFAGMGVQFILFGHRHGHRDAARAAARPVEAPARGAAVASGMLLGSRAASARDYARWSF